MVHSLHADISYFLYFEHEAKETGDIVHKLDGTPWPTFLKKTNPPTPSPP